MAESFFIRATLDIGNTNTFAQRAVELGSYVDALNQSILKVHRVDVAFTDNVGRSLSMAAADTAAVAQFQLTTQSQALDLNVSPGCVVLQLVRHRPTALHERIPGRYGIPLLGRRGQHGLCRRRLLQHRHRMHC
jgi:hypothetical protein